jgi:aminocarboxymuconate-semialdehyde decarboxylase
LDFFSADNVLFASDCPFDPEGGPMFIRDNMRAIEEMDISDGEKAKIFHGNATAMLRLPAAR